MIPIVINKKKKQIPSLDQLTVEQYQKVLSIIDETGEFDLITYISLMLEIDRKELQIAKVYNREQMYAAIGDFVDPKKETPPDELLGVKIKSNMLSTFGHRYMIEKNMAVEEQSDIDRLLFMTALAISQDYDIEKVNKIIETLKQENYVQVLSAGWFFFVNIASGLKKGTSKSKIVFLLILTKMKVYRSLRTLTDYLITPLSTRFNDFCLTLRIQYQRFLR